MITPQEVAQHAFNKATFNGYNMAQVDEFLDVLTADYTALYKENAVLKSKMKVLVDKIEEYRATEEAMRAALLTAQKMANTMVAEAEEKKAVMLREAENQAAARKLELRTQVADEEARLAAAQEATAQFTAGLRALLEREQQFLDSLPEVRGEQPQPAQPPAQADDPVSQAAQDIQNSMQHILAEEFAVPAAQEQEEPAAGPAPEAEPVPVPAAEEEDPSPTRRIDFAHLQFGKDYEIK